MVSLDLGGSGVRAVQFTLGKKGPSIEKMAVAPLPAGAIVAGEVRDAGAVSAALKELWSKEKLKSKKVVFSLANSHVLVRQMDLEWLAPDDFRKSLKYQAAEYIPMDIDEVTVDYHALRDFESVDPVSGQTRRLLQILLVVASNETLDGFLTALGGAGLRPVRAEISPFSLVRATNPAPRQDSTVEVLLDLGAHVANLVIHEGGQPRYVRIMTGQGGDVLTQLLRDRFEWSHDEAEQTKIALGMPTSQPAGAAMGVSSTVFGGVATAAVTTDEHPAQTVINESVSRLIGEVRQTVDFFMTSGHDVSPLSRVVLTGGGGNLGGFAQRLSSELRVPVEHGNPLDHLSIGRRVKLPDGVTPQEMSIALGLAMGTS
ncbi:type IV pilus assembly protein PilM [Nocardioides rubriscoriae]|uniref:type IV pilus assembly protein PilM n=1 Tax=Nocardioides rubriscoriae TaxID=642762 RepID=UPI0011E04DCE|nr:type IV pilus assembly protein PilM [Nocardioides rubriscoriae]